MTCDLVDHAWNEKAKEGAVESAIAKLHKISRSIAEEDGVRHRPPQRQAAGCGGRQPQARICDRGRFFCCGGRVWVMGSSQYLLPLSSSVFASMSREVSVANSHVLPVVIRS